MRVEEGPVEDVMQVCRNGHVVTDLLRSSPERGLGHCDRCGAPTLSCCPTCGLDLPGAIVVPGLQPIGARPAPLYCAGCGAAFPWTKRSGPSGPPPLEALEALLRRVPRVARQLRVRQGERPAFRVADEKDLEDLLRALLPLHFDDVRPECRTPKYAPGTRTDFLLAPEGIAVVGKLVRLEVRGREIAEQMREDAEHYGRQGGCRTVVCYVHDPEGVLREPPLAPAEGELEVRCVVGAGA